MMFGVSHLSASSSELLARKSALKSLLVRAVASRIRPRTRTTQITAHIRPLSFSLQTHLSSPAGLLEYSEAAAEDVQGFRVLPDFVSTSEEQSLLKEVARALRRSKYQYDHWDGAIEGYKETEKIKWSEANQPVIARLRREAAMAVPGKELQTLEEIHVLDLAADGQIKPHIDSLKFCGEVIAGLSLISSSVMKMQHQDKPDKWIHALLPKHSLYVMSGSVRSHYTHAIPREEEESVFRGEKLVRERRLSIICRTHPTLE